MIPVILNWLAAALAAATSVTYILAGGKTIVAVIWAITAAIWVVGGFIWLNTHRIQQEVAYHNRRRDEALARIEAMHERRRKAGQS